MPTATEARAERRARLSAALSRSLEERGPQAWWHQPGLDYATYLLDKLHAYDVIAPRATCKAAGIPAGSTYGQICWHLAPLLRELQEERDGLLWREQFVKTTGRASNPLAMIADLEKILQPSDGRPWWEHLGQGTAHALIGEMWASREKAPDAVCDAAGMPRETTFSTLARKLRAELPRQEISAPRAAGIPPTRGLTIEDLMAECSLRLRRLQSIQGASWWEEYGADHWWTLSAKLWSCTRTAPSAACRILGMPLGSTFAQLARVLRTDLRYRAPVHDYSPTKKKPRAIPAEVTDEVIEDMPETFGTTTVAILLGVPQRTVEHWLHRGWLSGDRAARGWWEISRDGLQEFLRVRPWAVEWRMTQAHD